MRGTVRLLRNLLTIGAGCAMLAGASAAQIVTNWVAYNDHRPGPLPTSNSWGTAVGVTGYDMRTGPGGNLTNFLTGEQLEVTINAVANGSPDDFPTMVTPYGGTVASNLFFGVVDVSNTNSGIGVRFNQNTYVTLTFSNLDPEKYYLFRGTAVRGGSYPLRWSVITIDGAETYVDAHSAGVLIANNFPASLEPGQAAFNSGDNRSGAVVGWDFISPGPDGSFSIISSNYVGQISATEFAANNTYGYAINAMLLAQVEVTPPVIETNPVADTVVEQNRPFSLSVTASGTPLLYQWYKEGTGPISGATFPTLSVNQAGLGDSGNYYVVVHNPLASVTSTWAQVTITADTNPPSVVTAFSYPSLDPATQSAALDQIIIEFSEPVTASEVTQTFNYDLSDGQFPISAVLTNDRTVILTLPTPLNPDADYTVTVNSVTDLVGNSIDSGGTNNPAAFHTWVEGPGNGLLFEAFRSGAAVSVDTLTGSPLFPDYPFYTTNLWAFDSRLAFADDTQDAYGSRIRGVFIPPVSGDWIFFLRAYDRAEVFLNPNGLDPAGKQSLVAETTGNDPHDYQKLISAPVPLRAGQPYYIEALQQANTGTDFIKVAARLAGTGLPPIGLAGSMIDTNTLLGPAVAAVLAPRDLGGALTITQQPVDLTVEENQWATFTVQVQNPSGLPVSYQWFKDGAIIPGANGRTYAFHPTLADSNTSYHVQAMKIGSAQVSQPARLSVVPDITRPTVAGVVTSTNLTNITVMFSELVESTSAQESINYILSGNIFFFGDPVLDATGTNVILTVESPLDPNTQVELTVDAVNDLAGNQLITTTLPLFQVNPQVSIERQGNLLRIAWPASASGFVLEQTSTLTGSPPPWTEVPSASYQTSGESTYIEITPESTTFYRLRLGTR